MKKRVHTLASIRDLPAVVLGGLLSFACVFFWISVESIGGGRIFVFEFVWTKWLAVGLVLIVWGLGLIARVVPSRQDLRVGPVDFLVLALVAWFTLSLSWSPDVQSGLLSVSHIMAALAAYGLSRISDEDMLRSMLSTFAICGMVGTLVIGALTNDTVVGNGLGNENWGAEFMVLCAAIGLSVSFPCSSARARITIVLSAAVTIYLVAVAPSHLALLALWFVAGYAARSMGRSGLFRVMVALSLITIVAGISLTVLANESLPQNVRDRIQTWGNVALMISDAPIGRGVGGYFHDGGAYVNRYQEAFPFLGEPAYNNVGRQSGAAENEFLHIGVEYGAVGAAIAIALLWCLVLPGFRGTRLPTPARWLPLPLLAALGLSLVSFPLQNAATLIPIVVSAGALAAHLGLHPVPTGSSARNAISIVAVVLAMWGVISAVEQVQASWLAAKAAAADVLKEHALGATFALRALDTSSDMPFVRMRGYTQVMIAGPQFWRNHGLTTADLDRLFLGARSASPSNPLVLDLRLKGMLSERGRSVELQEIEGLLADLKQTTGKSLSNAHILEAALAMQTGQLERARAALRRARQLLPDPPANDYDATNLANIEALESALAR